MTLVYDTHWRHVLDTASGRVCDRDVSGVWRFILSGLVFVAIVILALKYEHPKITCQSLKWLNKSGSIKQFWAWYLYFIWEVVPLALPRRNTQKHATRCSLIRLVKIVHNLHIMTLVRRVILPVNHWCMPWHSVYAVRHPLVGAAIYHIARHLHNLWPYYLLQKS